MSDLATIPQVDEFALQAIAQHSASLQAMAEQVISLAGASARAIKTAQQAVDAVSVVEAGMKDLKGKVNDLDIRLKQKLTIDDQQIGTIYQAVHDRAAWAVKHFPDEDYQTHIRRIWTKIKRDAVVNKYTRILEKDYDYAMQGVLTYPGFGRNWPVK